MDDLQRIIHTFSETESKEFEKFLQRNRVKSDRKDLKLFRFFSRKMVPTKVEVLMEVYGDITMKNPYHTLRKRLIKDLNDFIYLKRSQNDDSFMAEINKVITLVQHLFDHGLDKLAWKQLVKVERLALVSELNHELVLIYDLQIQHYSSKYIDDSIEELVLKRIDANVLFNEDETLKIIGSLLGQELEKVRLTGEDIELQDLANELFEQFDLTESIIKRPKLFFNFIILTRSIVLAKKDYFSFERFVIGGYKRIKKAGYFENKKSDELRILYMISHTLYRNKKFNKAIEYLDLMRSKLYQVNKGIFLRFFSKYNLLLAACENFKGNVDESVIILKELLGQKESSDRDIMDALLNLSVYYFEKREFKEANKTLLSIGRTDNWIEKNIGIEWRFKKNMIDVIFQYELGNFDIAYDRILSIEKIHKELFLSPKYQKVAVFLTLIKQVVNNPDIANSEEFISKVDGSFTWVEIEQEDIQAMSYYAWLKSKMVKKDFYHVLMDLIKRT